VGINKARIGVSFEFGDVNVCQRNLQVPGCCIVKFLMCVAKCADIFNLQDV
jgi:hypothetical protein